MKDRKMQRALMQFFKPENYFTVRGALIQVGRSDLIGGCDGIIPADPAKEAIEARRRQANRAAQGGGDDDHGHTVANPAEGEVTDASKTASLPPPPLNENVVTDWVVSIRKMSFPAVPFRLRFAREVLSHLMFAAPGTLL